MKNTACSRISRGAFVFFCAGVPLFLLCCNSDPSLVNPDVKGTEVLGVMDANTGYPLDSVSVQLVSGPSGLTDSAGEVTFENVSAGQYFVTLAKSGYEPQQETVQPSVQGQITPVDLAWSQTFSLHRKGVTISGRVLIENESGDTVSAAAGVTVELRDSTGNYGESYITALHTTKTSATGSFTFDSLPELSNYIVDVPQFISGGNTYSYGAQPLGAGLLYVGQQFSVPLIGLEPIHKTLLQAFASTTNLTQGQPLVINFSSSVDTSELGPNAIVLSNGLNTIAVNLSWSSNFTVLSITPYEADWVGGVTYTLSLNSIQDLQGDVLGLESISAAIPVATGLSQVQNLRLHATTTVAGATVVNDSVVDYATSPYNFSWHMVSGAEGYNVYYRDNSSLDTTWKLNSSTGALASDTTITIAPPSPTGIAWVRNYLVLPISATKYVPNSLGAVLTVTDKVKPSFNTTSSGLTNSLGTTFNNTTAAAKVIQLTVAVNTRSSEPVDTTKHPLVRVAEGGVSGGIGNATYQASGTFAWTGITSGVVTMTVGANEDGRRDTVVVDFSAVTDLAGNGFDSTATPVVKYVTQ